MFRRFAGLFIAAVFILIAVTGCSSLGPAAIQHSRTDYNVVLQKTSDEQLLLNLVRLRYRDRPLFLETSALTTQFKFAPSAKAALFGGEGLSTSGSAGAEFKYEEKPTVTYTPLQGQAYVQRVMSPISWQTLELLDNVGWRSDRLLRVCVQQLNQLGNATTAAGPTPAQAPEYVRFAEAARLYQELKSRNLVRSFKVRRDGRVMQMLSFDPTTKNLRQRQRLFELLDLPPDSPQIEVILNNPVQLPGVLQVQTRSFAGVLYYLSQSVEAPPEHVRQGRVTVTRDSNGGVFDWTKVTGDLMRIRSSAEQPQRAAVKVFYRGYWFYIDDADLESKSTFVLLGQLFALQSGEIKNNGPILTLPVGS